MPQGSTAPREQVGVDGERHQCISLVEVEGQHRKTGVVTGGGRSLRIASANRRGRPRAVFGGTSDEVARDAFLPGPLEDVAPSSVATTLAVTVKASASEATTRRPSAVTVGPPGQATR